nr:tyrosine-protein phosphatase [Limosilactobacillus gastricus]
MTQRLLSINDGENFRDLGGYQTTDGRTVKWRKLIRSGALGRLSANDLTYLQQFNLTHDIDLRSPAKLTPYRTASPKALIFIMSPFLELI